MESKTLVKTMQEYREMLVLKAPKKIVEQFDHYVNNEQKVAAIKILREQGIIPNRNL
jgi:hypothetical protein